MALWDELTALFGDGAPFKSNNPALDQMMMARTLPEQQPRDVPPPWGQSAMDLASMVTPYMLPGLLSVRGPTAAARPAEQAAPTIAEARSAAPPAAPTAEIIPASRLSDARAAQQQAAQTAVREQTASGLEEMRQRLLPQATYQIPDAVRAALKRAGNFGFDRAGEALSEMRSHPDWETRWDMAPGGSYYESLNDLQKFRHTRDLETLRKHIAKPIDWNPETY